MQMAPDVIHMCDFIACRSYTYWSTIRYSNYYLLDYCRRPADSVRAGTAGAHGRFFVGRPAQRPAGISIVR